MAFQWNIDPGKSIIPSVEAPSAAEADEMCKHFKANNIKCHVKGSSVVMDEETHWLEVIRASEKFIGARLIN